MRFLENCETVSNSPGREDGNDNLLDVRVRVPKHVVFREFPAETVVLNLQTEQYHGLNPTAGTMLSALGRSETVGHAARAVAAQFERGEADVRADVVGLCRQLLDRGLIEIVPAAS